jgi:hypothetical protein
LGPENRRVVQRGNQSYTVTVGKVGRASPDDQGASLRSVPEPEAQPAESLAESEPWAGPDYDGASPELEPDFEAARLEVAEPVRNEIDADSDTVIERAPRQPAPKLANAPLNELAACLRRFEASGIMDRPPNERLGTFTRRDVRRLAEKVRDYAEKVIKWVDIGESE